MQQVCCDTDSCQLHMVTTNASTGEGSCARALFDGLTLVPSSSLSVQLLCAVINYVPHAYVSVFSVLLMSVILLVKIVER